MATYCCRGARRRRPGARDRRVPAPARAGDRRDAAGALGGCLERYGWLRRLVERFDAAGPGRHDELASRFPPALRIAGHEPLPPRERRASPPRTRRIEAWLARHCPRSPSSQPGARRRGRAAASASSRATATRTRAAVRNFETRDGGSAAGRRDAGAGDASRAARRRPRRRARRNACMLALQRHALA